MDAIPDTLSAALSQAKQTIAALFIGFMFAAMGYGTGCLQMIIYYRNSGRDGWKFRTLIWLLWLCDTAHMGLVAHALYNYFVLDFGNPLAMEVPIWSLTAEQSVSILVEYAVRSVFTGRVWKLSKRLWFLTGCLSVINLLTFALDFSYRAFHATSFDAFVSMKWLVIANLSAHLLADLSITVVLTYLLRRSRTGFDTMDGVLRTLVAFVVQSGVATMLVSALVLATFLMNMHSFVFIGIYFLLCKVFFNALLASLNARAKILADSLEAGVSMTVLSTRHRDEQSRKDHEAFYQLHTPSTSMPDLPTLAGDSRRHTRRPSTRSTQRLSRQDRIYEIPRSPRSAPASLRGTARVRPDGGTLIPELPKFTHQINLSGHNSEISLPSPLPLPAPISMMTMAGSEERDLYGDLRAAPTRYPTFIPF